MIFLPSLLQHSPLITEDNASQEKKEQRGIINKDEISEVHSAGLPVDLSLRVRRAGRAGR